MLRTDNSRGLQRVARVTGISFLNRLQIQLSLNIRWFMKSGLEHMKWREKRSVRVKYQKTMFCFLNSSTSRVTFTAFIQWQFVKYFQLSRHITRVLEKKEK